MAQAADVRRPLVEVLYFDGCPNHLRAQALVERVSAEVGVSVELKLVKVADPATAARERFLGSPSIRIDGRDIEPGAQTRTDYALACRVYHTDHGSSGQPDERWLRTALCGWHPRIELDATPLPRWPAAFAPVGDSPRVAAVGDPQWRPEQAP